MHKNRFPHLALALAAAAILGACAAPQPQVAAAPAAGNSTPDWVNRGSAAFKEGGSTVIYGVGSIQGVRNIPLARSAADDKGRNEIGKILESVSTSLGKQYAASTTAGDMSKSSEEQNVSEAIKTFSKTTLRGAMPVDHYIDKENNIVYALIKYDPSSFAKFVADSKELDAKVRDFVRANAEKAFDELSAEEAKH